MALSGSCQTAAWTSSSDSSIQGRLVFNWTAIQNQSNNTSTISWNIRASVTKGWIQFNALNVKINSTTVYSRDESNHTNCYNGTQLASGTKVLTHNADGTCSFTVSIGAGIYSWAINKTGSGSFTLNPHTVYTLSLSAGTGSTISVNRTSSGYASTGSVSNGARLYYGDKLTITFAASSGYGLSSHTVNGSNFTSGNSHTVSANVSIVSAALAAYTLSISAGNGSSIVVSRTSSGVNGVGAGTLSNGARIYKNDLLKISFSANNNYELLTHTVNNVNFVSGNTHTVNGNTTIVSTARVLSSGISATTAEIGTTSIVVVSKHNESYYHTIQYSFGGLSGYILGDGSTSSTPVKISQKIIGFTIPTSFYAEIPNARFGDCTLTCKTYESASSNTQLGEDTTCTFRVSTTSNSCAPAVTGTVIDTNDVTNALTTNSSVLVKYKSTADCYMRVEPKNSATIVSVSINGVTPIQSDDIYRLTFYNVQNKSFTFTATDSRGYTTSVDISPTMVEYVILTCNPTVTRSNPTGNDFEIYLSGNFFRGSFSQGVPNTLEIQYQYKESSSSVWSTVENVSSSINYGNSNYSTTFTVSVQYQMAYKKAYDFKIILRDGHTTVNGSDAYLSTLVKTVSVSRGEPIFDWGQSDFHINVDTEITESLTVYNDTNALRNLNVSGAASCYNASVTNDLSVSGNIVVGNDITMNGKSIAIKTKSIIINGAQIINRSNDGAYYTATGFPISDFGISGTVIGLMVTTWAGAVSSFVPYYYNNSEIRFTSDVSQTVSTIRLLVTYL